MEGEKVTWSIQFVKVLLVTREINGHKSGCELSGTKKKNNIYTFIAVPLITQC